VNKLQIDTVKYVVPILTRLRNDL